MVEVDTSHTPATIHLRWQSPRPPLNGILRDYSILIGGTHKQRDVSIHLNESCAFWDNYICKSIRHTNDDIQVRKCHLRSSYMYIYNSYAENVHIIYK